MGPHFLHKKDLRKAA